MSDIQLVDTHCHIHFPDYGLDPETVIQAAMAEGVTKLLCVGCTLTDSKLGLEMATKHDNIWASIGLHPHEGSIYADNEAALKEFCELATSPKVVAIGETGLDYYYNHSPKEAQIKLLRLQLDLATKHDLPLIFHVRDAFDDFWPIFDEYKGLRGVIHSFTATTKEVDEIVKRGLYIGLNGIMTFTKNEAQLEAARAIPLTSLLVETDAPFLTPVPFRGKINEPRHVRVTAEFLSDLRGETLEELAAATTANAKALFYLR